MSKNEKRAPARAESIQPQQAQQQRIYKDKVTFDHDLYRLENETMVRNMAWSKKMKAIWEPFEHKHFFHTHDSDGRKQTRCVAALGHFHPMQVIDNGPGNAPTIICGPAHKEMLKLNEDGEYKKVAVPLEGREGHTHRVSYVASERLQTRKLNSEAVLTQSKILAQQTPTFTDEEHKAIREASVETRRDPVIGE